LIVVDASVVTDFLLARPEAVEAIDAALEGHEHEPLRAPELIEPEVLNALRRLLARGLVSQGDADAAMLDLGELRLQLYPHPPLRERVWALRDELTAYDATYLALAEALGSTSLITADRGLADRARTSLGEARVREAG
jgi:predicted nucleic acid-binding protein